MTGLLVVVLWSVSDTMGGTTIRRLANPGEMDAYCNPHRLKGGAMAGAAAQLRDNGTSDYGAAKSKLQTIVGNGGIVPFETSIRSLTNLLRCRRLPNATCRY